MQKSVLRPMALQVAGWGMLYGDFFDLHSITSLLGVPDAVAGDVMIYLRTLSYVETVAETRNCKREPGKRSSHRVFIKVIAIHPEPLPGSESFKLNVLRSKLARLSKAMPLPRGAR
ncbi:hypothetical protein [Aeromonas enterica]